MTNNQPLPEQGCRMCQGVEVHLATCPWDDPDAELGSPVLSSERAAPEPASPAPTDEVKCPRCGHQPHPSGGCWNMASDDDCDCLASNDPSVCPDCGHDDQSAGKHKGTSDASYRTLTYGCNEQNPDANSHCNCKNAFHFEFPVQPPAERIVEVCDYCKDGECCFCRTPACPCTRHVGPSSEPKELPPPQWMQDAAQDLYSHVHDSMCEGCDYHKAARQQAVAIIAKHAPQTVPASATREAIEGAHDAGDVCEATKEFWSAAPPQSTDSAGEPQCEHGLSLTEDYYGPKRDCPVHGDQPNSISQDAPADKTHSPNRVLADTIINALDDASLLPIPSNKLNAASDIVLRLLSEMLDRADRVSSDCLDSIRKAMEACSERATDEIGHDWAHLRREDWERLKNAIRK